MNCEKFCKGGRQVTNTGLVPSGLDEIIFTGENKKSSLIKKKVNGLWLCPLGCTQNPKNEKKTLNAIANNGKNSICHANKWRHF